MHCGLCREAGHKRNKCPNKDKFPDNSGARRKRKTANTESNAHTTDAEIEDELERQGREQQTGENDMMDEVLREQEKNTQGLDEMDITLQMSQQKKAQQQPKQTTSTAMKFVSILPYL